MKSLKHILGLLIMTAMIIAAGCNKEENGGKKENLPHPNSTYKACPILAHIWNDKLGIKEIQIRDDKFSFDEEQRVVNENEIKYEYDAHGRLIKVIESDYRTYIISYDTYSFIDSICRIDVLENGEQDYSHQIFKYSNDTVFVKENNAPWIIMKFSDDLYPILRITEDGLNWYKWSWKDGNIMSFIWHNNYGNGENKYQYDNSYNITKLISGLWIGFDLDGVSKNNIIDDNISYTYNERGLVETIIKKDDNGNIIDIDYVSYIYY